MISMHGNSIRKRKLPNEHREALPFGIHERQLVSGSNLLKKIPAAERYFERLSRSSPDLALLVLSKVDAEYHKTNHSAAQKNKTHLIASRDIQKLFAKGLITNKILRDLLKIKEGKKIEAKDINPHFVDAILRKKAIRLHEFRNISRKLDELGELDWEREQAMRKRIPNILSRTGVLPNSMKPYEFISEMIDGQIKHAKERRMY